MAHEALLTYGPDIDGRTPWRVTVGGRRYTSTAARQMDGRAWRDVVLVTWMTGLVLLSVLTSVAAALMVVTATATEVAVVMIVVSILVVMICSRRAGVVWMNGQIEETVVGLPDSVTETVRRIVSGLHRVDTHGDDRLRALMEDEVHAALATMDDDVISTVSRKVDRVASDIPRAVEMSGGSSVDALVARLAGQPGVSTA